MKKYALIVMAFPVIFGYGCLGDTEDNLIGTWQSVDVDPAVNSAQLTFNPGGQLIVADLTMATTDTGAWEATAAIDHRYIIISGLDDVVGQVGLNAEWSITRLDEGAMIISTGEFGGQTVRDFIK